jgi:hypothetical protein
MAIAILQHNNNHAFATTTPCTEAFGNNCTAGSTILCFTYSQPTSLGADTVTDTLLNTYAHAVQANMPPTGADSAWAQCFYASNASAGANTVSFNEVNNSGASDKLGVWIVEISGLTGVLDTTATATGTTVAALTSSAFTTTNQNDIVVAFIISADTTSSVGSIAGTTGTTLDNPTGAACGNEYRVLSTIQTGVTAKMNISTSANAALVVVAFSAPNIKPEEELWNVNKPQFFDPPITIWQ